MRVKLPHDTTIAQDQGLRLHNLLSRIHYRRDVDKALHFAARYGIIEEEGKWNINQIRQLIEKLLSDPVTAPWWADDNTVYTERSILSADSDTRRPDRVVRRPDGTMIVIDFKFGEQQNKYHIQVREYMNRLRLMGHQNVLGYLLYMEPESNPIVVEVKDL